MAHGAFASPMVHGLEWKDWWLLETTSITVLAFAKPAIFCYPNSFPQVAGEKVICHVKTRLGLLTYHVTVLNFYSSVYITSELYNLEVVLTELKSNSGRLVLYFVLKSRLWLVLTYVGASFRNYSGFLYHMIIRAIKKQEFLKGFSFPLSVVVWPSASWAIDHLPSYLTANSNINHFLLKLWTHVGLITVEYTVNNFQMLLCTGLLKYWGQQATCSKYWLGYVGFNGCWAGKTSKFVVQYCLNGERGPYIMVAVIWSNTCLDIFWRLHCFCLKLFEQAERDPTPLHKGARCLINSQMENGDFPQEVMYKTVHVLSYLLGQFV